MDCRNLRTIEPFLPPSVNYIGGCAFATCQSLESDLTLEPEQDIEWGIFYGYYFGASESDYSSKGLLGPKISKVTLGGELTTVPESCFMLCTNLQEVVFSGSKITSVGFNAFARCLSLKTVTPFLPPSLTSLGAAAFACCASLEGELTIHATDAFTMGEIGCWGASYPGFQFGSTKGSTMGPERIPEASPQITKVTLGSGVTVLSSSCFRNCECLSDVYFCGAPPTFNSRCFEDVSGPLRFFVPKGADSPWTAFKADPTQMKPWAEVDDPVKTAYFEKFGSSAPTPIGVALNAQINGFYICTWRVPGTNSGFMLIVK